MARIFGGKVPRRMRNGKSLELWESVMKKQSAQAVGRCGVRIWLLIGICLSPLSHLAAQDPLEDYNFAVGAYRQERWRQAEESFQKFIASNPTHAKIPTARLYRGLALTNLRDYKTARPVWRDFVRDYPQNKNRPVAMYRVAECSYLMNDLEAAEKEFQAFLDKHSDNDLAEWALPFLAETQLFLKKPAEALKSYKAAEARYPEGRLILDVKFGMARAHEQLNQPEAALEIYKKLAAEETNPQADQALLNLATIYFETQKFPEAADAYSAIEARFPKSNLVPTARLNAGYAWYQVGDFRKAISQFDKAAEEKPQKILATYWKGVSHKSLGEYEQAADILKAAQESGEAGSLEDNILYQWGDCAFRAKDYATARDRFLKVASDWPKSEFVEDSLQLAGEAALFFAREATDEKERLKRLDEAERVINSFAVKFPDSPLLLHHEMLKARLRYVQGGADRFNESAQLLRSVVEKSRVPATQLLARFHLGRTLQKLDKHAEVVEVMAPVLEEVQKTGAGSEFLSGLVVASLSHIAINQEKEAIDRLTHYLQLAPEGEEADLALATRALAHARLKHKPETTADLILLKERFPNSPLVSQRAYQVAELAYEKEDWAWAEELFDMVVMLGAKTPQFRDALSGLAWSEFNGEKYLEAATDFGRLAEEFSNLPKQKAEALYMQGRALEDGGDLKAAAKAYQTTFESFAPKEPASAGEEDTDPLRFAFLAGIQAARTRALLKEPDVADVAYEVVLAKFPKVKDLDKLLDEWALMNLKAQRFERSDEVFRMLIEKAPNSPLVDNARLSLAESDFVGGKLLDAKKAFQELATDPRSDAEVKERAMFQMIEILTEQRAWDQIETQAEVFLKSFEGSPYRDTASFRRAEAMTSLEKFAQAEPILKQLTLAEAGSETALARWFHRAWVLLAECQIRQKKYPEVEATITAFREAYPKSDKLYEAEEVLGRCYKNQAKWEAARSAFERSLAQPAAKGTETAAKSQLMIAETYWNQQDYKTAQEHYLKVYYNHTGYPDWQAPALYQAGMCDEKLGDLNQASKTYAEVIAKFPNSKYKELAQERWAAIKNETSKASG